MLFHSSIQIDLAPSFGAIVVVLATILQIGWALPKLHRMQGRT